MCPKGTASGKVGQIEPRVKEKAARREAEAFAVTVIVTAVMLRQRGFCHGQKRLSCQLVRLRIKTKATSWFYTGINLDGLRSNCDDHGDIMSNGEGYKFNLPFLRRGIPSSACTFRSTRPESLSPSRSIPSSYDSSNCLLKEKRQQVNLNRHNEYRRKRVQEEHVRKR